MALISLLAVHPSLAAASRFLAFVVVFNLIPGMALTRHLLPRLTNLAVFVGISLGVGIVLNLLAVIPVWAFGQIAWVWLLPIVAVAVLIVELRVGRFAAIFASWRVGHSEVRCLAAAIFVCLSALLGVANVLVKPDQPGLSFHFGFQSMLARGLERGWPPQNLLLGDVPLSYHYAAHLWVLEAKDIAGVPLDVLVARYAPIFFGGVAAMLMLSFGRSILRLRPWIAVLAVTCPFWIVGIPPIAGRVFGTFLPFGGTLILSPYLQVIVFLVTAAFVINGRPRYGIGRAVIVAALTFVATGARGTCPAVILAALGWRLTLAAWRHKRLPHPETEDAVAAAVGFGLGLYVFFILGSAISGTGFVHFHGQPFGSLSKDGLFVVSPWLIRLGVPLVVAGIVAFTLIAVFQAGFLAPGLPIQFMAMRQRRDRAAVFLLAASFAGISGIFLTDAPGHSHFTFVQIANIGLPLLGGRGLQRLLSRSRGHSATTRFAVTAAVGVLGCVQLAQLPRPAVTWIASKWPETAVNLVRGRSNATDVIAPCLSQADADLLGRLEPYRDATVLEISPQTAKDIYCESVWLVTYHPIQMISNYAYSVVPGNLRPPLDRIFDVRKQHLKAAFEQASSGVLSVPDVVAIATTMGQSGPFFVWADRDLSPSESGRLEPFGSDDRFTLWRLLTADVPQETR